MSAPRDVELLVQRLQSLGRTVEALARVAEDLHAVAYDRPANGEVPGRGRGGDADPLTGDTFARVVFTKLFARARDADDVLLGFKATIGNLLNVGQVNGNLYGSDLHGPAELAQTIKAQRRREARGEYTPARNLPQPKYPSKGDKR